MAMYGQGVTRGRVALLDVAAAYNQACAAIHFSGAVKPEFGRYFFIAAYHFVRDTGNETSQMNLSVEAIRKFKILVPPVPEQEAIVAHLNSQTMTLDRLVAQSNGSIRLLRERRAALITAAVTGQIDLRMEQPTGTALEPA